MYKGFEINGKLVGRYLSPYIIAEIGVNHEGDINLAKRLIDEAKRGGAHAAKFQTYKAGELASKNSPAYWDTGKEKTSSQYKLFKKYDRFEPEDYVALSEYCQSVGIDFLSTPFDLNAVDVLEPLVPAFKIASADITNIPLLRKCASTGKPMILSTGASSLAEIEAAIQVVRAAGCDNLALLHCVLNYPTPEENAQLGMIRVLQRTFPEYAIGYSDHVIPDHSISALEAATLLGSVVLEKHFTHDKSLPGNDHYHAMNLTDLQSFKTKLLKYRVMIDGDMKNIELEMLARQHARRSVVAARNIRKGEEFSEENLTTKRPGHGVSPMHWDEIVGRKASRDIEEDSILSWQMID